MGINTKLQGGVITSFEKRSHGVVELLAIKLRDRLEFVHYSHAHEIDVQRHRFIIVFTLDDLSQVVTTYQAKDEPTPLIIHIDTPTIIRETDYVEQFPYVEIAPVAQADLSSRDVTLQIDLFGQIIEFLDRLK